MVRSDCASCRLILQKCFALRLICSLLLRRVCQAVHQGSSSSLQNVDGNRFVFNLVRLDYGDVHQVHMFSQINILNIHAR